MKLENARFYYNTNKKWFKFVSVNSYFKIINFNKKCLDAKKHFVLKKENIIKKRVINANLGVLNL